MWRIITEDELGGHLVDKLLRWDLALDGSWLARYEEVAQKTQTLVNELDKVAELLSDKGISVIALKNAGIVRAIYPNHACSPMGDIDLLVAKKDFKQAHNCLVSDLRYTFEFRSDLEEENLEEAFLDGGTEYFKDVGSIRVWLELQWRPIAGRWIQPHLEPDGDELIERSLPIEGSDARVLCPVDNLLQVCLHTAKHSYCRAPGFRLHSDVDRIVRFSEIDWSDFLTEVCKLHVQTAVYYSLLIPKVLLKTPIPDDIVQALRPPGWKRRMLEGLLDRAGLTNQTKKKFSRVGYIRFNLLLYDSFGDLLTGVFPSTAEMKKRYQFASNLLIPIYHIKRIYSLLFKRARL
ncbi:MAG: nucleotidyltransferase family protein [Saprospiraceae bacterium]|nr:nucleotidyltransferase family protein [Saprospiraceae bacterium]